jgi:hypothetical protein
MQIDTNVDEEVNFYKEKYKSDEVFEYLNKKYKVKSFSYLPYFKVHTFVLEEVKKEEISSIDLESENLLLKKKIENLHIALNKKVEKNKNQKEEISLLLKQKEGFRESENVLIKMVEELKESWNVEAIRANEIVRDKNFENLHKEIDRLNFIIKYLEDRLNEK